MDSVDLQVLTKADAWLSEGQARYPPEIASSIVTEMTVAKYGYVIPLPLHTPSKSSTPR